MPPDKKDPEEPKNWFSGRNLSSIGLWVILLVMVFFAVRYFLLSNRNEHRYDEFREWVRQGRVAEVTVGNDEITGILLPEGVTAEEREEALEKGEGTEETEGQPFVVTRIKDGEEDLVAFLEEHGVEYKGAKDSSSWLPLLLYGLLPVILIIWMWRVMFRRMGGGASGALSFGKSKSKIHGEHDVKENFEDAAGVQEAKEELKEIIEFLREPKRFTRLGARIPKGVLLVGPPGTGKTLLARAVAGEAKVPFFSISGSEFVEMFVGVGASRVRDLFEQASKQAPCIVFIDELDALGKSRGLGMMSGNDEREQTLNQLLVEMDGFDTAKGVIIMAATNRPEILDVALLRPGRFDRQILVDRPDRAGRLAILDVHAQEVDMDEEVDLEQIANRTPGFAGAELANVVNEGALLAVRRGHEKVTQDDLNEAVERVVAGLERKSRIITEDEKLIVAHHEVGHALVAEFVKGADKVHKISIVPRGMAALGYTMQMPTEDRYLMKRSELMAKIASLLGGRVAEEIIFGEVSTGAQNDLQRASEIARAMVVEFGMSDVIGPISLARRNQPVPVFDEHGQQHHHGDFSEDTCLKVDGEVRKIVDEARERAHEVLVTHKHLLERLASKLLEDEFIEGEEFRAIIAAES
jgi:cell division protease FtsH